MNDETRKAVLAGVASQKAGIISTSLFTRKSSMGLGSLCTGNVVGALPCGRPGEVSTVSMEMRKWVCWSWITYDVNTETEAGKQGPRKVAKPMYQLWTKRTEFRV